MDRRAPQGLTAALAAALLPLAAALGGDPPAAGPPAAGALDGADAAARIAKADELEKSDVAALAKAITALGASKGNEADREFLCAYALGERSRLLRILALEALAHVDKKASAQFFKGKADGKDALQTVVALEALGHLGAKEDLGTAVELIKSPDVIVAVAAADCAARLASSKDLDAIAEAGLAHPSEHVTDHTAWAVLDLLKKPKVAADYYEKKQTKKGDARSIRVGATAALLRDGRTPPQEWKDSLTAAKDLVQKAPVSIEVAATSEEWKKNIAAALEWLKTNMPANELLVRAAAKKIEAPGKKKDSWLDVPGCIIQVPPDRAVWKPNQLALHLFWMGTVLWQARIGEPSLGHRGWEPAISDVWDLCVVAKLYDAGPGGLPRAKFVEDQVAKHPWGGD
jgi:hypothetical protein